MINGNFKWTMDPVESLGNLSSGLRNKAMRIALLSGASPVKSAIMNQAPTDTGALQKAMRIKVKNYRSNNTWVAIIGASSSFKRKKGKGKNKRTVQPSRYQHLVDKGTKFVKGTEFLNTAFEQSRPQFVAGVMRKLQELVPQLLQQQG
jgi:HK97 gp10 family phage protein